MRRGERGEARPGAANMCYQALVPQLLNVSRAAWLGEHATPSAAGYVLLSNGDADVQFNIRGKRTPFLSHHVDFPDFGSESPPGSGSSECPQLRALLGG